MEWTAPKLLMECEAADDMRDKVIESLSDRIARYVGEAYGYGEGQYWPENYYFTWVSYILPQIIFQNPRVKIGSLRLSEITQDAQALELAINRWITDTDQRIVLRQLGFDMGFSYGISFTSAEPIPGAGHDTADVPWRPQVTRLNQRLYSIDPLADGPWNARFQQHITIENKDDMLEWVKDRPEEGWNREAIEQSGNVTEADLVKSSAKGVPDRNELAFRTIWCPGDNSYRKKGDDPESYNGTLYTISMYPAKDKELQWLRPPRAAFVPRWGPYTLFGAHPVPGCPYPMGSLVAVDAQLQELNALALGNYRAARRRKRIGLFDETETAMAEKIAKAMDGDTVAVPGFDKQRFLEIELGGVTETGIVAEESARLMADRNTGLSDVQKGGAAEGQLATSIIQAVSASNVRTADLSEQFVAGVRRQYTTVLWYMWKLDKVSVPLSIEDIQKLREKMMQGGVPPEVVLAKLPVGVPQRWTGKDNKAPFDSMELSVEPYSMKRTDEPVMQARAMQALQIAAQLAPVIPPTISYMRWKNILEKVGDSMNWPGFADILDEQAAIQVGQQQMQMAMQAGGSEGSGQPPPQPQPRLLGDIQTPTMGFPKPSSSPRPMAAAGGAHKPAMSGAKPGKLRK